MIRKVIARALLATALLAPAAALAEVVVIVHPSVAASANTAEVADLFLGKSNALGGTSLTPIDQEEGSATREAFYQKATSRTAAQLNAYWSRIIFSGKGQPPKVVGDDDMVKEAVAANPSLIGYIDKSALDSSVRSIVALP